MFKHVVNVNEEGVIVIDYSRRKLHSDIYAAGDVSQADGHACSQVIVTHMAGEESELDNGQKLDKQYEVLLMQGGLLLGGDRHEGDF